MSGEFDRYCPDNTFLEVEFRPKLLPVIRRIGEYLSPEKVWKHFLSSPSVNGGVSIFPYLRVDSAFFFINGICSLFEKYPEEADQQEWYRKVSEKAMCVILWIEVGFQGLGNLAKDDASRSWTGGVGHFLTDKERAKEIMDDGRLWYDETMSRFVLLRDQLGIENDCFTRHELEGFLHEWRNEALSLDVIPQK